jgi:hypothetical protein
MNTLDTLKAMRELLADPSRWTRFNRAKDAEGHRIAPTSRMPASGALSGHRPR